jgi:hypothetical protein
MSGVMVPEHYARCDVPGMPQNDDIASGGGVLPVNDDPRGRAAGGSAPRRRAGKAAPAAPTALSAVRPVSTTNPSARVTFRWKFAGSSRTPDRLVDPPEVGDRELRPTEPRGQRRVLEPSARTVHGVAEDLGMVDGECSRVVEQRRDRVPVGRRRVGATHRLAHLRSDGQVGHGVGAGHGAAPRRSVAAPTGRSARCRSPQRAIGQRPPAGPHRCRRTRRETPAALVQLAATVHNKGDRDDAHQ